ncbi:subtilisin-like protein [Crucibulum laeve]|uniref:tripeptidyl-peptidase II n=1 Tax=Crucibulum laeve TaxID=68775 RepID=A0A5C3LHG3_9AGAR|nr:subtilisin-like protein [Crucibulum laeve]
MRFNLAPIICLSLALLTAAHPSPYILHEARSRTPAGWTHHRRHESSAMLPLRFGLKQSNMDRLEEFLYDVSHPESPNYGNHWTPAQIQEKFAPSSESIDAVRAWLVEAGIPLDSVRLSPSKAWIEAKVTVEDAERLLKTEYHVYQHESGKKHIACDSYHLPSHISSHVDIVTPSIHFDTIISKRNTQKVNRPAFAISPKKTHGAISMAKLSSNAALDSCSTQITPDCIRSLYGINYTPKSPTKNTFGIVEYTPSAYLQADLDMFASYFSTSSVGKSPNMVSIDGGVIQTDNVGFEYQGESDLDLQYAMTLVGSTQNVTLYQAGDLVEGATFNNFLDALDRTYCTTGGGDDPFTDAIYPDDYWIGYAGGPDCGIAKPANVISTSYGYNEADLSPSYTARQCAEYAKLGMMGVTFVYSSGDNGVAGGGNLCFTSDGYSSQDGTIFNPGFPASCPFVTTVGATQIKTGGSVTDAEIACQQTIFSGGGFSNHFSIPSYQKTVVQSYLKTQKPTYATSIWNSTGNSRAFPDISANGAGYIIAANGQWALVSGTSASTPVVASMLTLINDARITAGKKPIGFINPTIYSSSFASSFNDIVSGSNPGCGTGGFNASVGWDPVTGLGTPKFSQLMTKFMALP